MSYKFAPAMINKKLAFMYDPLVEISGLGILFQKKVLKELQAQDGESILDIGCGTGTLGILLKKSLPKSKIVGLDPDGAILQEAEKKAQKNNVKISFIQSGAERLPFPNNSFDHVVSSLAFHHMPLEIKKKALSEIYRVLKPQCKLLLVDVGKPKNLFWKVLIAIESIIEPKEYFKNNTSGIIPNLIKAAGFSIKEKRNPYMGIYFWEAKKSL